MDYVKLITEALAEKKWNDIARYATEAKNKETGELFIGVRKGYVNIFYGYDNLLESNLKEANIKTFFAGTQPALNKLIKAKQISLDIIKDECVVVFTSKATVVSKLISLNYPVTYFTVTNKRVGVKGTEKVETYGVPPNTGSYKTFEKWENICTIKNKNTGESIKFILDKDNTKALAGFIRDNRINDIFDDEL